MRKIVGLGILISLSFFSAAFAESPRSVEEIREMLKDAPSGSIVVFRPEPRTEYLVVLMDSPPKPQARWSLKISPGNSGSMIPRLSYWVDPGNVEMIVDVVMPDKPEWTEKMRVFYSRIK